MPIVPVSFTGSTYVQDFTTLAASGASNTVVPAGWGFVESGTGANTTYAAGDGAINAGNTYRFGTGKSIDRAFGEVTAGSVQTTIGAAFVNNTGHALSSITIGYTGEQWRLGDSAAPVDILNFQYSLDATDLNNGTWIDANALDFSSPNN